MSNDAFLQSRIRNDFTYHKPPADRASDFVAIREKAKELALLIESRVPTGRELSSALTRLEEAVFHANAGIARQYPAELVPAALHGAPTIVDPHSDHDGVQGGSP